MAKMPEYYIMPRDSTFPEVVSRLMEGEDASLTQAWLPDTALDIYVQDWQRTELVQGKDRARFHVGLASLFGKENSSTDYIYLGGKGLG
jgi:uncharacterized protein (DUF2267 family)